MTNNIAFKSCSIVADGYVQVPLESLLSIPAKDRVALDLETTKYFPQQGKILICALFHNNTVYMLTYHELQQIWHHAQNWVLVGHNLVFDTKWLIDLNLYPKYIYDTSIIEKLLNNNPYKQNFALAHLLKKYLNVVIDKSFRDTITENVDFNKLVKYAHHDVIHLFNLLDAQMLVVKKYKLERAVIHECKFTIPAAYSEYWGVGFNQSKWSKVWQDSIAYADECKTQLDTFALANNITDLIEPQIGLFDSGKKLKANWNAAEDKKALLNHLGIKVMSWDKQKKIEKDSTGAGLLKPYFKDYPIVKTLVDYSTYSKNSSTFGDKYISAAKAFADSRIRTCYNTVLTSGRMSSGETANQMENFNPQFRKVALVNVLNIPKLRKYRECFEAGSGFKFLIYDYSGQETRILAEFSQDPRYLEFIINPENDLHAFMAKLLWPDILGNLSYAEVIAKHQDLRDIAKRANFALGYGGNYMNIHLNCGVTIERAKEAEEKYYEFFSGLKAYFEKTFDKAMRNEYILINGVYQRKMFLKDAKRYHEQYQNLYQIPMESRGKVRYWHKEVVKACRNLPIQGTGADMIKESVKRIWDYIIKNDHLSRVRIPLMVHDELCLEVENSLVEEYQHITSTYMVDSAKMFCPTVPFYVDGHLGDNWGIKSKK